MLGVGDKFPEFKVKATVSTDKNNAFKDLTNESYPGKWKIYFFWPKDFTFVCPTEIAGFGKLNGTVCGSRRAGDRRKHGFRVRSHGVAPASSRSEGPAVPDARRREAGTRLRNSASSIRTKVFASAPRSSWIRTTSSGTCRSTT